MAGAGVAAAIGSGTIAGFSDTEVSTPDTIGAATVVLGGRGEPPRLVYEGLRPGKAQTVDVAVDYQGSVAADVDLRLTAAAERSGFCDGSGGTLTVAVDQAAAVDYCTLLDGRATRLASVSPGTMARVRVTVTLSADASPALLGRAEQAVVTVQASGGFTDRVRGAFSATTAASRSGGTGRARPGERGRRTRGGRATGAAGVSRHVRRTRVDDAGAAALERARGAWARRRAVPDRRHPRPRRHRGVGGCGLPRRGRRRRPAGRGPR